MVHIADTRNLGAVLSGNDTCKIYEQLAENTLNDICLRVVCELFYI